MHATDSCGTGTGYTNASSNKSSAQLGIGALSRVLAPRPIVVADACFQVTVAPSVSGRTDFILYVLDPEPERFALVTTNLYGLQGYYRDGDEGATALRHVAVAGFGRAPLAFDQNPSGFDSAKLSELRRADFTGSGGASQFLEALYKAVLLVEEELLQLPKPLTSSQRAVSGFSLSGLMAVSAYLDDKALFQTLLGGEVSLEVLRYRNGKLYDKIIELGSNSLNAPGNVLWQLSEHTRQKSPDFAAKMDTFADILARRNHNVTRQSLSHGTHHTVKPLVVLMELQWLEDLIGSRAVTELTTQSEP
eukprot:TRINITY_DN105389_c0_g1_i2.p1 TRINITY_DN105389_c0_g1~~TRINITY_DN105389_c0_g1_i2.p1  ORF type:complete len:305 (+),score=34.08 TRINITY_DN105389_c0_g1_i2:187-1101(+)